MFGFHYEVGVVGTAHGKTDDIDYAATAGR